MKGLIFLSSLVLTYSKPQLSFGGSSSPSSEDANTRLGLLASNLGLSPTAETEPRTGSFTELELPTGRVPGGGSVGSVSSVAPVAQSYPGEECCCIPADQQCFDLLPVDDLVGEGLIDPRIVNRPPPQPSQLNTLNTCPAGYKTCCYAPDLGLDLSTFQRNSGCISPLAANTHSQLNSNGYSSWTQGCTEPPVYGAKQCGTRSYSGPVPGLQHGQTSPGEFPWTCILLNQNNDFIGTCAVIPDDFSNNNNAPTRKILTAAHKLKNIEQTDLLKVRVGEWDATGIHQHRPGDLRQDPGGSLRYQQ